MANRTTVKQNITTLNVPTVTNTILNEMLKDNICDNIKFNEDVIVSQTSSVSGITCNFTGKDRIDLTRLGGALNITLTGIVDGETKFLIVTKTAGQAITFVNANDVSNTSELIDANQTVTVYEIFYKGSLLVRNINQGVESAITNTGAGIVIPVSTWSNASVGAHNIPIVPNNIAVASKIAADIATQQALTVGLINTAKSNANDYTDLNAPIEGGVLTSIDLDTVQKSGFYRVGSGCTNYTESIGGELIVSKTNGSDRAAQIYNSPTNITYTRHMDSFGAWGSWYTLARVQDLLQVKRDNVVVTQTVLAGGIIVVPNTGLYTTKIINIFSLTDSGAYINSIGWIFDGGDLNIYPNITTTQNFINVFITYYV